MVMAPDTGAAVVSFHCSACGHRNLTGALARRQAADRPVTAELRGMEAALQRFAGHLRSAGAGPAGDPAHAALVESYLAA